jgi:preprotein translocase subunit SecF
MKMWWDTKAWPWLQKNWQWVLLPVGALAAVGKVLSSRKTTVVGSELTGAAATELKVNEEAATKAVEASTERTQVEAAATEQHDAAIRVLTDEQKSKAEQLSSDPVALNDYLKTVGKDVRK